MQPRGPPGRGADVGAELVERYRLFYDHLPARLVGLPGAFRVLKVDPPVLALREPQGAQRTPIGDPLPPDDLPDLLEAHGVPKPSRYAELQHLIQRVQADDLAAQPARHRRLD